MKTIATHNGDYHADEIFAVATLKLALGEEVEVIRTRIAEQYSKCDFVVDVGGIYDPKIGRFDHHQFGGAGSHPSGIPYSSFGLVWKEFGLSVCGDMEVVNRIEAKIVEIIDGPDNGISIYANIHKDLYPYTINDLFASYFPSEEPTKENIDRAFLTCVSIAKDLLSREISQIKNQITQEQIVADIYEKSEEKGIIILDKRYSWFKVLSKYNEPMFVVCPDTDNSRWSVKGVRSDPYSFDLRKRFPESWAGKTDKELQEVSGVSDAVFCHNARFIAIADSKEGAIELANKAFNS